MSLPIQLPDTFTVMLHHGIASLKLSPSYISAVSWYVFNLFGFSTIGSFFITDINQVTPQFMKISDTTVHNNTNSNISGNVCLFGDFQLNDFMATSYQLPIASNRDSIFGILGGSQGRDFEEDYDHARQELNVLTWSDTNQYNFGENILLQKQTGTEIS